MARAIQRLRTPLRWPQEKYNKAVGGPSGLYTAAEPERIENAGPAPVAPSADQDRRTRSFQIRMADWLEHGSTPGCQKCNPVRDIGWNFLGGVHFKACMERQLRLERAKCRLRRKAPKDAGQSSAAAQEELLKPRVMIRSEAPRETPRIEAPEPKMRSFEI